MTRALWVIGQGHCPRCKPKGAKAETAPELQPAGNSSLACPVCDAVYPIGGGVP